MANMSYVRFENTYHDLQDCYVALETKLSKPFDELSESEKQYAKLLIALCRTIVDDFEDEVYKK